LARQDGYYQITLKKWFSITSMGLFAGLFARARIAAVSVLALVVGMFVAVAPVGSEAPAAQAADMSQFQAGNIIADALFFDGNAMTAAEVQAFLNSKLSSCAAGFVCLRDFRETTRTIPGNPMCSTYQGAANETAATIIYKVGKACGISQKAILVMLQKEQGLVTSTAPSAGRFRSAMGAGCPDTAACDSTYYGFFNQVHYGSYQLKRYTQPPGTGPGTAWDTRFDLWKPVGQVSNILFSPVRDGAGNYVCGTKPVYIANQATHSLYIYTPYTPNQAALNAGYGLGDGCSAYGNRNFYNYYTDWFGSTQAVAARASTMPQISGQNAVGATLTASPGTWLGTPKPTITYRWQACNSVVATAVSSQPAGCVNRTAGAQYVVTAADIGKFLTVAVTGANSSGSAIVWSASTPGAIGAPSLTTSPVLAGTPAVGSSVSVNTGTWAGSPTSYAYQWFACTNAVPVASNFLPAGCSSISGAATPSWGLTKEAAGKHLSARVSALNGSGASWTWTRSVAVTKDPFVTGTVQSGRALSADVGGWLGATSFAPVPTDGPRTSSGYPVKAIQTYLSRAGFATDVDGIFGPQTGGNVRLYQGTFGLGADGVVGPATWGHMVAANTASTYTTQWQRCTNPLSTPSTSQPAGCTNISGAAGSSYTITSADIASHLTVLVTATRGTTVERRWAASSVAVPAVVTPTPTPTPTLTPTPSPLTNPPTVSGTAAMSSTLTASSGQWLGAPSAAVPTDGRTYSANAYPVKAIQTYLTRAGFATTVDGAYGPRTAANVKAFQVKYSLKADGIVGPVTWNKMLALKLHTTYKFQWIRCSAVIPTPTSVGPATCTDIASATAATYRPVAADAGSFVAVRVYAESGTKAETRWSASTVAVAGGATATPTPTPSATPTPTPSTTPTPAPTTSPALGGLTNPPTAAGTAKVSQVLTATSGQWLGAPTAAIPADGPKYGRNRYPVKSIQTYLTRAGIPTTVDGAYGPIMTANVRTFQARQGLLADGLVGPVTWSRMLALKLFTTYSYQWVSCTAPIAAATATAPTMCTNIVGATSPSYVVKNTDLNKHIAVRVTGVSGTKNESRWSVSRGPVVP
jgi:peptidoglycan hydrolase-like protein with peptidoglycan-binding domain